MKTGSINYYHFSDSPYSFYFSSNGIDHSITLTLDESTMLISSIDVDGVVITGNSYVASDSSFSISDNNGLPASDLGSFTFSVSDTFEFYSFSVGLQLSSFGAYFPSSSDSSHVKGFAADIKVEDSQTRFKVVTALFSVGFSRVGVADSFIHCDCDSAKPQNVVWTY